MRQLLLAASSLLLMANAGFAMPPDAAMATGQSQDISFRLDSAGRMTVPVTLGENGTYRFLVDTGAERTVISRQLATHLGYNAGPAATIQSVIGVSAVGTVDIPSLRVSSRSMPIDGAPMLESLNIGADGMLGVDSLASQQVVLDFKRGTMLIAPSGGFQHDDPATIVVTAKRRHGRLLFTDATIDGRSVVVVIDTGSEVTIGNAALRRKLRRSKQPSFGNLVTVAGEHAVAELLLVKELHIGPMTGTNVELAFLDAPVFRQLDLEDRPAILLGMNVLRAFDRVSIDFATRRVRFVLPSTSMIGPLRLASEIRSGSSAPPAS